MDKLPVIVSRGEGERLQALGADVRFLCLPRQTGDAWSLMEVTLPADAGPPPHEHPWNECYYVIEGEVRFTMGERTDVFGAGDFLYAPAGTVHGFQGASKTPARVLVFDAPAAAEGFFRDIDREVRELPRDLGKVPEIAARHRMRFLPA
ncbi:MAG: cupin domain-containing protein [Burkholderiaceae bacterium]|nr:cupin domain-containing protein [Burkholderiaceae bacterium]